MKFSQAVKLGHQNLAGHKRRNLAAIITAGILFGVLMAALLVVQGLENSITQAHDAAIATAPYYLKISTNLNRCDADVKFDENGQIISSITTCPDYDVEALKTELAKYQGELENNPPEDNLQFWQNVLKLSLQLDNIPKGASPVLLGAGTALNFAHLTPPNHLSLSQQVAVIQQAAQPLVGQTFISADGELLYLAGLLPTGELAEIGAVYQRGYWQNSGNPVNLLLKLLGAGTPELPSGVLYLSQAPVSADLNNTSHQLVNYHNYLAKFANFEAAYQFASAKVCVDEFGACEFLPEYNVVPLVGNQIQTTYRFQLVNFVLNLVKYAIMLIALIVMLITCIKVIQAEAITIKLYRSLGASSSDLNIIYGAYLLEFCLFTVAFALMVGVIIAGIISLCSATGLGEMLSIAYARELTGTPVLLGWNFSLTEVIIVMLLVAPLGLLLCQKLLRQNH